MTKTKKKEKPDVKTLDDLRAFMKAEKKDYYLDPTEERDILPTGFYSLDNLLWGGLRSGTYVELFGKEGTGKTYLALNFMRSCQEHWGKPVCYVSFEKAWEPKRARQIGLDLDPEKCVVIQPPNQEKGYDFIKEAVKSNLFGVIVIDSMSAMVPISELEKDIDEEQVAKAARVNSKAFRVLTALLQDTIVVFINQLRTNVGVLYGDPDVTTGGKALAYYAHHRLALAKLKIDKDKKEQYSIKSSNLAQIDAEVGHIIKMRLRKSKFGNEGEEAEFLYSRDLMGIDEVEDIKAYLFNTDKLSRAGMAYSIEGVEEKFKGKDALYEFIDKNPDVIEEVINKE